MKCSIVGLGTALPPDEVSQAEALEMSAEVICENQKQERLLRMLFRKAGVDSRRTAIPWQYGYDWKKAGKQSAPASPDACSVAEGPGTAERMRLYSEFAGPLATRAAQNALDNSGVDASEITHLVLVSCTGFEAPGVDIQLIQSLQLKRTTQRVNVGYMGCHGAVNGLRVVRGLVAADPEAKVLMCCVELCSLHYRMSWDDEGMVGNALFADGAAAIVAVANHESSLKDLVDTSACLIDDSQDEMSWKIGDHGFQMRLTSRVPERIECRLLPWISEWLQTRGLSVQQIRNWVVHPGGPRIVDSVQNALSLADEDLVHSRDVLREYGNMSSPTVLFILDRYLAQQAPGPTVVLAFGPGLMAEVALLDD